MEELWSEASSSVPVHVLQWMSSEVYSQGTERFSSTHPRRWSDPTQKPSHCHLFITGSADSRWSPFRTPSRFLSRGKTYSGGWFAFQAFRPRGTGPGGARPPSAGSPAGNRLHADNGTQHRALLASVGAEQAAGRPALRAAFCPHGAPGAGGEGRQPRVPVVAKQTPSLHGTPRTPPPPPPTPQRPAWQGRPLRTARAPSEGGLARRPPPLPAGNGREGEWRRSPLLLSPTRRVEGRAGARRASGKEGAAEAEQG